MGLFFRGRNRWNCAGFGESRSYRSLNGVRWFGVRVGSLWFAISNRTTGRRSRRILMAPTLTPGLAHISRKEALSSTYGPLRILVGLRFPIACIKKKPTRCVGFFYWRTRRDWLGLSLPSGLRPATCVTPTFAPGECVELPSFSSLRRALRR